MGLFRRSAPSGVGGMGGALNRLGGEAVEFDRWLRSLPWRAMRNELPNLLPVNGVEWRAGGLPVNILDERYYQAHLRAVFPSAVDGMLPALVQTGLGTGLNVYVMGGAAGLLAGDDAQVRMRTVLEARERGVVVGCRALLTASAKGSVSVQIDLLP